MPENKQSSRNIAKPQLAMAGLLVVIVAFVSQMLSLSALTDALTVSAFCFAIAMPCLAGCMIFRSVYHRAFRRNNYKATVFLAIGYIAGLVGTGGVFWHFSPSIGAAFIVTTIVAVILDLFIAGDARSATRTEGTHIE